MKRVGVFVDVANLYHCVSKKYKGKLDYVKYLDDIRTTIGGSLSVVKAFGGQVDKEAMPFISFLQKVGFDVEYRKAKTFVQDGIKQHKCDCDTMITMSIIRTMDSLDVIVLGSADSDFLPLIKYLTEKGKRVIVYGCMVSSDLDKYERLEITASLLESHVK